MPLNASFPAELPTLGHAHCVTPSPRVVNPTQKSNPHFRNILLGLGDQKYREARVVYGQDTMSLKVV